MTILLKKLKEKFLLLKKLNILYQKLFSKSYFFYFFSGICTGNCTNFLSHPLDQVLDSSVIIGTAVLSFLQFACLGLQCAYDSHLE